MASTKEHESRLWRKVCIITGAGSEIGLGRATAWTFAKNGARAVYITDFRDELLPQLAKDINAKYPNVQVIPRKVDAASEESVKAIVKESIDTFGRLDVFFANAGTAVFTRFQDIEVSNFMNVMRVNTLSVFLAIKYASAAMKIADGRSDKEKSCGSIIATASVAGLRNGAGPMDYSASKAAVINLAQTGAWELYGTNVRVNAICPGLFETGMTKALFDAARIRGSQDKIGQLNPMRRAGVTEEVANLVVFLASDESSYVNGQAYAVCGGLSASHPITPGKL
ncbi:6694_t:CDS:10 [Acaulospora morrowiae]|uniref:6694_t:CDS:1 n=1 Tax=Acaulospora morrowiae TaxID=94023 RepID=A0A9N9D8R6_9GLOM|nr:6694_t:CDS:10 [Acaulospora morrowiae]